MKKLIVGTAVVVVVCLSVLLASAQNMGGGGGASIVYSPTDAYNKNASNYWTGAQVSNAYAAADVILGGLLTNYAQALAILGSNHTIAATNALKGLVLAKAGDTADPGAPFNWNGGTHSGMYSLSVTNSLTVSAQGSNVFVVGTSIVATNFDKFSTYRPLATSRSLGFTHDGYGLGIGAWNAASGFDINLNGSVTHGGGATIGEYYNHPLFMTGNGTPSASRLGFGASPGTYWHTMLYAAYQPVRYEFWSTSVDGAGTDGILWMVETNGLGGKPMHVFTNAPVAFAPVAANVTNAQVITPVASTYYLTGIGSAEGATDTITLSAPGMAGQQLDICCGPGTNKVAIADSGTVDLSATWTGWTNDTLSLWAPTKSTWVERTRCVR